MAIQIQFTKGAQKNVQLKETFITTNEQLLFRALLRKITWKYQKQPSLRSILQDSLDLHRIKSTRNIKTVKL